MARKTKRQLDADIAAALARGEAPPAPPHVYPTDTNIFALTELVMDQRGRSPLSNQIHAPSVPHIRRCVAGGLLEVVDRRSMRLTPAGKATVIERIKQDMARDARKPSTDPYYMKRDAENYEKRSATLARLEAA